jgi:hypothetical protein
MWPVGWEALEQWGDDVARIEPLATYAHLWPTAEDKTRAAVSEMAAAVLATHLPRTQVH